MRLVTMTKKEFKAMVEGGIRRYADENVKAGYWSSYNSLERSREAHDNLLPNGSHTEGHHFYTAKDSETDVPVGHVWIRVEPGEERRGFIFTVFIEEGFRGRGYGRAMMEALEAKARLMKISSLALHVFAYNDAARHLYESLGYDTMSLNMLKKI
ncbi:MAG: GNAT family N-acetyltransferase [Methanomassiliicoccales archaeon]|nr:GNAT family N-acetyltransferase [Methanomassiliicoccales archaeon]